MIFTRSFAAAAFWAAAALPAAALPAGFSSFWIFGDSLSDDGNLYAATDEAIPQSPPYYAGRFSNGPVWADRVAADFGSAGLPTGNFAYGGARATTDADPVPDLQAQLGLFAAASRPLGAQPLAAIWLGANDAFAARDAGDPTAIGEAAADDVRSGVQQLAAFGIRDFLLPNLPTLGDTVNYADDPTGAARVQQAGLAYNARLESNIEELRDLGLQIISPDMQALFDDIAATPSAYGITEPLEPCLSDDGVCEDPSQYALWDAVHPTATIHAYVADEIRAAVAAAVPLPAAGLLLLGGLGSLTSLRRRSA